MERQKNCDMMLRFFLVATWSPFISCPGKKCRKAATVSLVREGW